MAFGLSFGAKKSNSSTTENINKNESTNQTGSSATNSTQTNNASQTGSTTGSSQGATTTNQAGSTTAQGTATQQQTGVTKSFSDPILQQLESAIGSLMAGITSSTPDSSAAVQTGLAQLQNFDPATYVADGLKAAQAQQQSQIDEATGGLIDSTGGADNSAVALLRGRLGNDAAAAMAGVRSALTESAQGIVNTGLQTASAIGNSGQELLTNLLSVLRGGVTTTEGQTATQTAEQQQTAQQGTTGVTESRQEQTAQVSQETQVLQQLINQLLNSNTTTNQTGTSSTKGKDMSVGATFST